MTTSTLERKDPAAIAAAWQDYRAGNDRARARDAAESFGITEAELVASGVGSGTTRLDPDWRDFLEALPALGQVMALTRNDYAVHEKTGRFDRIMWDDARPVVLDRNINLRINIKAWRHAFALVEQMSSGPRRSLQIFDPYGTAVHKIYLRQEGGDAAAFDALVARFASTDQTPRLTVEPPAPPPARKADAEIDADAMVRDWNAMSDTHDIFALTRRYGAGRVQAFKLVPDELAREVDTGAFSRLLEMAAAEGEGVMIFVGSPGLVQIHIGQIHRVERRGPWQNVLDPGFDLHLLERGIASCWVIRKPTKDGWITSLEIFDDREEQIAWVFGQRKPGTPQLASWNGLVDRVTSPVAA